MITLYPTGFKKHIIYISLHNVLISTEQDLRAVCPSEYTKAYFYLSSLLTLSFLYRIVSFLGHSHSSPAPSPFTPATILLILQHVVVLLSTPMGTGLHRRVRFPAICSPHLSHTFCFTSSISSVLCQLMIPWIARTNSFFIFVFPEPEYSRCSTNTERISG